MATYYRLQKITAGSYHYGPFTIYRDGRFWNLHRSNGVVETFAALRPAMIAARVVGGVASESDFDSFVPPLAAKP